MKSKCMVDVGSRLGVALYYVRSFSALRLILLQGYFFSNLASIVGVEYNPYFANIQKQIIKKYKMESRVKASISTMLSLIPPGSL